MSTPHRRTYEMGMDFEWDNKMGPTDANSPWKNAAHFSQYADGIAKKRTFGDLARDASPFPASSSQSIFAQPSPSRPTRSAIPAHMSNAFSTPRKSPPEVVDSSEAESTPGGAADSEATPNTSSKDAMGLRSRLQGASQSLVKFVNGSKELQHPHVGEIKTPSKMPTKSYHEDRITKRRRRDGTRALISRRRGSNDSDDASADESSSRSRRRRDKQQQQPSQPSNSAGFITSVFNYMETHPALPHILSWYAQLAVNIFVTLCLLYMGWSFWATIRADVDNKSAEAAAEIRAQMAVCARSFTDNGCSSPTRAPALENVCNEWQQCMQRDPTRVGRAKVSAHTFAEIFNSFVEPISFKAMIFVLVIALGIFAVSNMAFGLFRNKHAPPPPQWYQHPMAPPTPYHQSPPPPATPQQGYNYWDSQQQQQPQTIPGREPTQLLTNADTAGASRSPTKRILY